MFIVNPLTSIFKPAGNPIQALQSKLRNSTKISSLSEKALNKLGDQITKLNLKDDFATAFIALSSSPKLARFFSEEIQKKHSDNFFEIVKAPQKSASSSNLSDVSSVSITPIPSPVRNSPSPAVALQEQEAQATAIATLTTAAAAEDLTPKTPALALQVTAEESRAVWSSLLSTIQEAKSFVLDSAILENFPLSHREFIKGLIEKPNPVLSTLLKSAKNPGEHDYKTWSETVVSVIKTQKSYLEFSKAFKSVEHDFLRRFNQDEQPFAKQIFNIPKVSHGIASAISQSIAKERILQHLSYYFDKKILTQTLWSKIARIYQGAKLALAQTYFVRPGQKLENLINLATSGDSQSRELMRMLALFEIQGIMKKALDTPKALARTKKIDDAVTKAQNMDRGFMWIHMILSQEEKALVSKQEWQNIKSHQLTVDAKNALETNNSFALLNYSQEDLTLLPEDLRQELLSKGFDLSGDDDL